MDPSYLNLASKVFVSDKYSLNTDFSKSARSLNVDVGSIDFTHPKTAAETINEWVSYISLLLALRCIPNLAE